MTHGTRLSAWLAASLTLGSCGEPVRSPTPTAVTAGATATSGKVVVSIVVDQLAAWIASERLPELPPTGGFARLLREGTYVREARFAHAITDTAPGHAALYTCAEPARSGIPTNERLEAATGGGVAKAVPILRDGATHLVDAAGETTTVGSSAGALALPTIADDLRAAHPEASIVSISLKDRAAIPGGGRSPTATLWFDAGLDRFVTSTAFATELPRWAVGLASTPHLAAMRTAPWVPLDAEFVADHARTPDAQAGEGAWEGLAITFPHALGEAKLPAKAFRSSPLGDAAILDLATGFVRADGFAAGPTFIALSLSSNDYVGHVYGVDSWEAWDNLARLDQALARFFDELDRAVGPGRWSAVLGADHGAPPMPETSDVAGARPWCTGDADRWERPCGPGSRVDPGALMTALEARARATAGAPAGERWVLGVVDPYVVLDPTSRAALPDRAKLIAALLDALRSYPGILDALDTAALPASCGPDETVPSLVCRSFRAGSGDVYFVTRPGSFVDVDHVPAHGTNHGSPWIFDRSIPILARDPGRVPAGVTVESVESFETFARTVSGALGLEAPTACRGGRDLGGAHERR